MTKEEFLFKIQTKTEFEFKYKGLDYNLTYGIEDGGKEYILFGRTYEGKKYYSAKELLVNARIENHFFREMLEDL